MFTLDIRKIFFQPCLDIRMPWQQKQNPSNLFGLRIFFLLLLSCTLRNNLCSCDWICYSPLRGHCSTDDVFWVRDKAVHHFQLASWFGDYIWLHQMGKHKLCSQWFATQFACTDLFKPHESFRQKRKYFVQLGLCIIIGFVSEDKRVKHNQYVISQMMQKTYYYYIKTDS